MVSPVGDLCMKSLLRSFGSQGSELGVSSLRGVTPKNGWATKVCPERRPNRRGGPEDAETEPPSHRRGMGGWRGYGIWIPPDSKGRNEGRSLPRIHLLWINGGPSRTGRSKAAELGRRRSSEGQPRGVLRQVLAVVCWPWHPGQGCLVPRVHA